MHENKQQDCPEDHDENDNEELQKLEKALNNIINEDEEETFNEDSLFVMSFTLKNWIEKNPNQKNNIKNQLNELMNAMF